MRREKELRKKKKKDAIKEGIVSKEEERGSLTESSRR